MTLHSNQLNTIQLTNYYTHTHTHTYTIFKATSRRKWVRWLPLWFSSSHCFQRKLTGITAIDKLTTLVTPDLKKPNADLDELNNYWPISNLTYILKEIECMVVT